MTKSGPVELSEEDAFKAAINYEQKTGLKFPYFKSIKEAVESAKNRSESGGASKKRLVR